GIQWGIENSWIGLILEYGFGMASLFICGIMALLWEIWRRSAPHAIYLMIFFLVLVTSAAGLSVKSFLLNHFTMLMLAVFSATRDRAPAHLSSIALARAA
ncbi:MAG: hypothetical protein KGL46_12755, partial [Hyphomicrobiales bacterium]|nr:hypothetical protein [Hyphomicrobiales bacterium]